MRKVELVRVERVFDSFFGVDEATLRYERTDGTLSREVSRLSVERGDAAAVLIYNRATDNLIFVRQFRYPTMRHGEPWLIEIVAGAIDEGETPEQAARREVEEEVGYAVESLEKVAEFYGSPGGLSEKVHVFFAEVDETHRRGDGGGLDGEDVERIDLVPEEVRQMLRAGEIRDAKALVALQWYFSR